jgi:ABC-type multidrug transport system fused ATPase/permease subunit
MISVINLYRRAFVSLGVLTEFGIAQHRVAFLAVLTIAAAFFEGFGMAIFLPVLQFVEKGQDVVELVNASDAWRRLHSIFSWTGIPINLMTLLSIAIGIILIRVGLVYARQLYSVRLTQEIQHAIRSRVFDAILSMSYPGFSKLSIGGLMNVLLDESRRAASGFGALFAVASNVTMVIGFIVVLLWLSISLTLFAVVFLGATGVVVAYYSRHTRASSHSATEAADLYSRQALERLAAFRLVKLIGTSIREAKQTRDASATARDSQNHMAKVISRVDLIMEPMVVICGGVILYLAVPVLGMSLSEIGLFMLILLRLLPVTKEVMKSWQSYLGCTGSLAAVRRIYAEAQAAREVSEGSRRFNGIQKSITFEHLSYFYPNSSTPALFDISLEIPAGRTTALVGPSGSGKTTLVDLIPKLRLPTSGKILFDGIAGEEFDLVSLRRAIGFVSQDAIILDDTISANLRFVRPDATETELWTALTNAQAAEFVRALPDELNTRLGDRGTRLSGGQKQRLSLARALLQRTEILVLDEPTSALDYETEKDIQVALDAIRENGSVTIIIIAHRFSTIRNADQIIVMIDGKIVQRGRHDELSDSDEWYSRAAII